MRIERLRSWLAATFLLLCLLLGGASAPGAGALGNALLQALAILLILFSVWGRSRSGLPLQARGLTWLTSAFVLSGLISLVPLPAGLWQALPGRDAVVAGFELIGSPKPSLPASLNWQGTLASLLWLLPPIALFLMLTDLSPEQRRKMPWILIAAAVASVMLGAAQLLGGSESPLRFYEITNPERPVGFFANANHLATLLLCTLPIAGYLAAHGATSSRSAAQKASWLSIGAAITVFVLVGIALIGSLAGFGLAIPAAAASLVIYRRAAFGPLTLRWWSGIGVLFLLFLGLAFTGPLNNQALSDKLDASPSSRGVIGAYTAEAVRDFFPIGSGLGTFPAIYRTYDNPEIADVEHVNHAHNDYLETALELGAIGILIIVAFLAWFFLNSRHAWTAEYKGANLSRAASVIILVILIHSVVDYPLRTSAIAVVFAAACALLVPPRTSLRSHGKDARGEGLRHLEAA